MCNMITFTRNYKKNMQKVCQFDKNVYFCNIRVIQTVR